MTLTNLFAEEVTVAFQMRITQEPDPASQQRSSMTVAPAPQKASTRGSPPGIGLQRSTAKGSDPLPEQDLTAKAPLALQETLPKAAPQEASSPTVAPGSQHSFLTCQVLTEPQQYSSLGTALALHRSSAEDRLECALHCISATFAAVRARHGAQAESMYRL